MALLIGLLAGGFAHADIWDQGAVNDNTRQSTRNELAHGSDQYHDLAAVGGVADVDWYAIGQKPYSSWEVIVDSTSANVGPGLDLARVWPEPIGEPIGSAAITASLGFSRSLRWANDTAAHVNNHDVRVRSNGCTTTCTANDVYRIRVYETTGAIPRFNNAGSQVTVVFIQNPTSATIIGKLYFWSGTGTLLHTQPFTVGPKSLYAINSSTVTALAGQAGSITVTHNGRYGSLTGKAVSIEASTGFTFDTPMAVVPN